MSVLELGNIGETAEIRIAKRGDCTVKAQWRDGTLHEWITSAEMPDLVVVGHAQSLNGEVKFKEPELTEIATSNPNAGLIMCRLYALRMVQAWAECDLFGHDIEIWPLASFHNAEAVAHHIPATMEDQYHRIITFSSFSQVMCEKWTDFIGHHLEKMARKGQAPRHAIVRTGGMRCRCVSRSRRTIKSCSGSSSRTTCGMSSRQTPKPNCAACSRAKRTGTMHFPAKT